MGIHGAQNTSYGRIDLYKAVLTTGSIIHNMSCILGKFPGFCVPPLTHKEMIRADCFHRLLVVLFVGVLPLR